MACDTEVSTMTKPDAEWARKIRDSSGKLPAFAWPGGYPIVYITFDGDVLCPECANGGNGSLARTIDGPDDWPSDGWRMDGYGVHYEGPPELCCHCNTQIESAYGDPDDDTDRDARDGGKP